MTKSLNALVAVAILLLPMVRLGAAEESSQRRPNVVIFLADDAGWGDYGHNGNKTASTPNIDRLAQSGASFDRFFVCPVCAPTRAEFLTGRYHLRSGVSGVSTGQERMSPREKTLADAFHAAGYATARLVNGTTEASGPTIRWLAASTNITATPRDIGANTSIHRSITMANQCEHKVTSSIDVPIKRSILSIVIKIAPFCVMFHSQLRIRLGLFPTSTGKNTLSDRSNNRQRSQPMRRSKRLGVSMPC